MPKKNGFEVLETLKGDPKTKKVPVVVLSNLGQEEDKQKVKELGAEDYLVKVNIPISDVVKKVYGYLGLKK